MYEAGLQDCSQGDIDALMSLYDEYGPVTLWILDRYLGDQARSERALVEVWGALLMASADWAHSGMREEGFILNHTRDYALKLAQRAGRRRRPAAIGLAANADPGPRRSGFPSAGGARAAGGARGDLALVDMPETDLPETDLPETDLPETDLPETGGTAARRPEVRSPDTGLATTDMVVTETPGGRHPVGIFGFSDVLCDREAEALELAWFSGPGFSRLAKGLDLDRASARGVLRRACIALAIGLPKEFGEAGQSGAVTQPGEEDLLAAEMALDLPEGALRRRLDIKRRQSPEFQAAINGWKDILSGICAGAPGREPLPGLGQEILLAAGGHAGSRGWRGPAREMMWMVLGGIAAAFVAWAFLVWPSARATPPLAATLVVPEHLLHLDLIYTPDSGGLRVISVSSVQEPGFDWQVWMLPQSSDQEGAVVPLGVLSESGHGGFFVPEALRGQVGDARFAISSEPEGGTFSGPPQGLLSGHVRLLGGV